MRRRAGRLILAVALILVSPLAPDGAAGAQESRLVVMRGLGGTPEMEERFRRWSVRLVDAARDRFGLPTEHVTYLAPCPDSDPDRITARSTREELGASLERIAADVGPGDRILLVLLGHGSWDGERSRFSVPGPDPTASDFAAYLELFDDQTVALVNAASASGEFVSALSGPRTIVITATSTGRERNATVFGRFFSEALAGDGADIDRDGATSLLEAFTYARTEVERFYEERNLLLTEHAVLDDDGNGEGTGTPTSDGGDGSLAARFVLTPGSDETGAASPELRALYDERLRLEEAVRDVRAERDELDSDAYLDSLETLLVELARTNRRIGEREGGEGNR